MFPEAVQVHEVRVRPVVHTRPLVLPAGLDRQRTPHPAVRSRGQASDGQEGGAARGHRAGTAGLRHPRAGREAAVGDTGRSAYRRTGRAASATGRRPRGHAPVRAGPPVPLPARHLRARGGQGPGRLRGAARLRPPRLGPGRDTAAPTPGPGAVRQGRPRPGRLRPERRPAPGHPGRLRRGDAAARRRRGDRGLRPGDGRHHPQLGRQDDQAELRTLKDLDAAAIELRRAWLPAPADARGQRRQAR
ncbi:hypothetical protein GA0115260_121101 [Streptomyces sp. MnatMP-M27]|nr:hypothetical protein GA0115260_121101 [Streptomyces sp. MnatMP-M27]